ncbi:MAG: carbohydrate kinase [Acidiferrobacterales bacterium]|nr:carbohydrate kinase [Acidiferrobacterales bacterium]
MACRGNGIVTAEPLVFGEVLFDCFPDGTEKLGGAPFNVAWHLQGFGLQPLFVSRVGNDVRGKKIRSAMENWGMSLSGLQLDDRHETGAVSVTLVDGEPAFDIVDDRAYDHIDSEVLPVTRPALIYHGTLALRNQTTATTLQSLTAELDAPVFVDVNLRAPWWSAEVVTRLIGNARWVKLNELELKKLSPVDTEHDTLQTARAFLEKHRLRLLIVTLGEAGALAIDSNGDTHFVQPKKLSTVIDTVGAGDAFSSVIILGLLSHWPIQPMLERAQQFASVIVGVQGAIVEDKAIYSELISKWNGEIQ